MTRIRFEDLPSTNTPINAENLNKLNNVIVSSEEPTTGEEVWIQRGKNLINFQSFKVASGDGGYGVYGINILNLKPLTPYTISFTKSRIDGSTISNSALYPWYKIYFYKNDTLLSTESCPSSNVINGFASGSKNLSKQFVTPTECNRVKIHFDNNNGDANLNTLVSNIQLEQGEVATPYEPYITKKIHTKNDNGTYEEFYNEKIIECGENDRGKYIKYADGTMICSGKNSKTIDINRQYEGVYYNATEGIYFPIKFSQVTSVIVTIEQNSTLLGYNLVNFDNESFNVYIWKPTSKTNVGIKTHFWATGRWK